MEVLHLYLAWKKALSQVDKRFKRLAYTKNNDDSSIAPLLALELLAS